MPCYGTRSWYSSRNVRILRCSCDWRCNGSLPLPGHSTPSGLGSVLNCMLLILNPFGVGIIEDLRSIDPGVRIHRKAFGLPVISLRSLRFGVLTAKSARMARGTQRDFRSGKRPEYGQILLQPRSLSALGETFALLAVWYFNRKVRKECARDATGFQVRKRTGIWSGPGPTTIS
jgi:hypothetical protein